MTPVPCEVVGKMTKILFHRFLASREYLQNSGYLEALMLMMLLSVGWLHGTGNPKYF